MTAALMGLGLCVASSIYKNIRLLKVLITQSHILAPLQRLSLDQPTHVVASMPITSGVFNANLTPTMS